MTRNAMVKAITEKLGRDEIERIKHIDRPTWWLRQMANTERMGIDVVECPKIEGRINRGECETIKGHCPDYLRPDCITCENF